MKKKRNLDLTTYIDGAPGAMTQAHFLDVDLKYFK